MAYWGPATVDLEPEPDAGPIVVSIEYEVSADQEADFLSAMESMRRSRLRSGASRWDLYRVGESPDIFLEQFQVPTWREHQRQHDGRLTAEDQAIEDAAFAHIVGAPRATPAPSRNPPQLFLASCAGVRGEPGSPIDPLPSATTVSHPTALASAQSSASAR